MYPRYNRIDRGSGIYTCAICKKQTRRVNQESAQVGLCGKCYEEAGYENEHSDYGHPKHIAKCPTCRALKAEKAAKALEAPGP